MAAPAPVKPWQRRGSSAMMQAAPRPSLSASCPAGASTGGACPAGGGGLGMSGEGRCPVSGQSQGVCPAQQQRPSVGAVVPPVGGASAVVAPRVGANATAAAVSGTGASASSSTTPRGTTSSALATTSQTRGYGSSYGGGYGGSMYGGGMYGRSMYGGGYGGYGGGYGMGGMRGQQGEWFAPPAKEDEETTLSEVVKVHEGALETVHDASAHFFAQAKRLLTKWIRWLLFRNREANPGDLRRRVGQIIFTLFFFWAFRRFHSRRAARNWQAHFAAGALRPKVDSML